MTSFILSPYDKALDRSDKDYVMLYGKGSKKLPTRLTGEVKDFRLFINDVASCATSYSECKWDFSILTFNMNGEDLNIIKDYGRISMAMVTTAHDARITTIPTTAAQGKPLINSSMMLKCLENSLDDKVRHQLMSTF
jgi:hypothetical protein